MDSDNFNMLDKQQIVKDLIDFSGLSQVDFAKKHKIPPQQLSDWKNGVRNIKLCTLELIAFDEKLTIKITVNYENTN
jgi:transcriptional regulator with XRE-family HTH domain